MEQNKKSTQQGKAQLSEEKQKQQAFNKMALLSQAIKEAQIDKELEDYKKKHGMK